jgi:inner membrane transporter RhtA
MLFAALLVLPFAVAESGAALVSRPFLQYGLFLACVTSLVPYPLEIVALGKIPGALAGMLQSLHPVAGALFGVLFLGEYLLLVQWIAILCIVAASVGCSWANKNR